MLRARESRFERRSVSEGDLHAPPELRQRPFSGCAAAVRVELDRICA